MQSPRLTPPLITLRQTIKVRYRLRTVKPPIPNLLRQYPRLHPQLPTPLHRILRRPRPIEPAPPGLEADHLRLGVHHEPLLVNIAIGGRIGVRVVTGALGRFEGAGWGGDDGGRIGKVKGSFPPRADANVVEVGGAVGVRLGPFAAEGGAESGGVLVVVSKDFVLRAGRGSGYLVRD